MSVTIDSVLVKETDLAAADLDGRVVVLNVGADAFFGLNGVATEIWRMLSQPCRVGDIFDALSQSHDVDDATLSRDVLPFLQQLIERRLAKQVGRDVAR